MTEVYMQNRSSKELPDNDPNKEQDFGFMQDHPFKAKIFFDKSVATYIFDRIWSKDQKILNNEDGSIILEFTVSNKSELISFVLGFGDKATILAPLSLKEEIKEKLENTLNRYQ